MYFANGETNLKMISMFRKSESENNLTILSQISEIWPHTAKFNKTLQKTVLIKADIRRIWLQNVKKDVQI